MIYPHIMLSKRKTGALTLIIGVYAFPKGAWPIQYVIAERIR